MGKFSGKFQLEPDGFSIHTFELTKKLSRAEKNTGSWSMKPTAPVHSGRSTGTRLGRETESGIDANSSSGKGCGSALSRTFIIRS